MADIRIKVAKDKAKLVKALRAGEGSTGLFSTYVDILVFSATLGLKYSQYIPFLEHSRKDPDPIPEDHFLSKGVLQVIDLIAVSHTKDPKILSQDKKMEKKKKEIFEFYANGGLEVITNSIKGSQNYQNQILLLLSSNSHKSSESNDFELDFLLNS